MGGSKHGDFPPPLCRDSLERVGVVEERKLVPLRFVLERCE